MNNYFNDTIKTICDALGSLDEKKVNSLVNDCITTVLNGGKIIATGLGKNVPICEKFVGTLNSLGINAAFLHTNTAIHGDLGVVHSNDLVIILSKSGNTSESIFLAQQLMKRNTECWLITFSENSQIGKLIECNNTILMNLNNEGDLWDIVPNNSTTIYLIFLQYIAIELQKRLNISIVDFKNNHPGGGIGEKLKNVGE